MITPDGDTGRRYCRSRWVSRPLAVVREQVPEIPTFAVGYSFGALIALAVNDDDLRGTVLVAPPLTMLTSSDVPSGDVLVLAPTNDQFSPAEQSRAIIGDWPHVDFHEILDADHFLGAEAHAVSDVATVWVSERVDR